MVIFLNLQCTTKTVVNTFLSAIVILKSALSKKEKLISES